VRVFTGPSQIAYSLTDADGTMRSLHFLVQGYETEVYLDQAPARATLEQSDHGLTFCAAPAAGGSSFCYRMPLD